MRLTEDERLVEWLAGVKKRPRKTDVEEAIGLFCADMMSVSQVQGVARFLAATINGYGRVGDRFGEWFGVAPTPGFLKLAKLARSQARNARDDESEEAQA